MPSFNNCNGKITPGDHKYKDLINYTFNGKCLKYLFNKEYALIIKISVLSSYPRSSSKAIISL